MPTSSTALRSEKDGSKDVGDSTWKGSLTPEQFAVLRGKGTDRPFAGKYDKFSEKGVYLCSACEAPLYTSETKFDAGCGWPAFWDCLPKAVREEPDEDGRRVEILCNACNGHLGHVFRGERFNNPMNERHCVNSTSIVHRSEKEEK